MSWNNKPRSLQVVAKMQQLAETLLRIQTLNKLLGAQKLLKAQTSALEAQAKKDET